jgi:hypothetical protein
METVQMSGPVGTTPATNPPANIVETATGVAVDPKIDPTPKAAEAPKKPTYEELEASYTALRTKMSKDGAPAKVEGEAPKTNEPVKAAVAAPSGEEAAKAVAEAGLDMATLEAEYAQTGKLSEESLAKLEVKGLSRDQVDAYIKGQEARGQQLRQDFAKIAGDEARLTQVYEWAATNLQPADLQNYNGMIDAGNTEGAKLMLKGIVASYEAVNGREPQLITGNSPRGQGIVGYESNAQMVKDMSSNEYASDPAFRAKVDARVGATKSFAR